MKSPEHSIQCAFFRWCRLVEHRHPAIKMIFAVPNGGHRDVRTAVRLKAEGVKAGVWDVFVPWQANDRGGLWVEFKSGANILTVNQKSFYEALQNQYQFVTAYTWETAAHAVWGYLNLSGAPY